MNEKQNVIYFDIMMYYYIVIVELYLLKKKLPQSKFPFSNNVC